MTQCLSKKLNSYCASTWKMENNFETMSNFIKSYAESLNVNLRVWPSNQWERGKGEVKEKLKINSRKFNLIDKVHCQERCVKAGKALRWEYRRGALKMKRNKIMCKLELDWCQSGKIGVVVADESGTTATPPAK